MVQHQSGMSMLWSVVKLLVEGLLSACHYHAQDQTVYNIRIP